MPRIGRIGGGIAAALATLATAAPVAPAPNAVPTVQESSRQLPAAPSAAVVNTLTNTQVALNIKSVDRIWRNSHPVWVGQDLRGSRRGRTRFRYNR